MIQLQKSPVGKVGAIAGIIDQIEGLMSGMEARFDHIADELFTVKARSTAMVGLSDEISAALSGQQGEREVAELSTLLSDLQTHYQHERSSIEQGISLLDALTLRLVEATTALKELLRKGKQFGLLSTFVRIESSAIADRDLGFEAIASEVELMATDIQQKLTMMLGLASDTSHRITLTLAQSRSVEHQEEVELGAAIAQAHEALALLRSKNLQAGTLLEASKGRFGAISSAMDIVITSVQFHDITRQRLDHIATSLRDLDTELGRSGPDSDEALGLSGDVAELEERQLIHANRDLDEALCDLIARLSQIKDQAAANSRSVTELVQAGQGEGETPIARISLQLNRVMQLFRDSARAEAAINQAMKDVNQSVGELTSYIDEIEDIGLRIENVALNAFIKSSRAGTQGAALGVVANQIQRLSVETQERITRILAVLHEAASHVGTLSDRLQGDEVAGRAAVEHIAEEAQRLLAGLEGLDSVLRRGVAEFQLADSGLEQGLAVIGEAEALRRESSETMERASRRVAELGSSARRRLPVDSEGYKRNHDWIADRMARYTMQQERHAASDPGEGSLAGGDGMVSAEFGDNIELF